MVRMAVTDLSWHLVRVHTQGNRFLLAARIVLRQCGMPMHGENSGPDGGPSGNAQTQVHYDIDEEVRVIEAARGFQWRCRTGESFDKGTLRVSVSIFPGARRRWNWILARSPRAVGVVLVERKYSHEFISAS